MPHPFAYSLDGAVLVIADGKELLVYDGPSEGPLWRQTLPGPVIAVGATANEIVSLDGLGTLTRWKRTEPEVLETVELGAIPNGLEVWFNGLCAVWSDSALYFLEKAKPARSIELAGVSAVGIGLDGRAAVGFDDGAVRFVRISDGEIVRETQVESRVTGLGYGLLGTWFVAAGNALFQVPPGKDAQIYRRYTEEKFESLTCSVDGSFIACRLAGKKVLVQAISTHEVAAVIQYFEREVGGVAFGPWPWLGVGLDLGDGNKIDLETGSVNRTDEHPGRPHNRWMLQADVKEGVASRARRKTKELLAPAAPAPAPAPVTASQGSGISWHWILAGLGLLIAIIRVLSKM